MALTYRVGETPDSQRSDDFLTGITKTITARLRMCLTAPIECVLATLSPGWDARLQLPKHS